MTGILLCLAAIAAEPTGVAELKDFAGIGYDRNKVVNQVNFYQGATDEYVRHVAGIKSLRRIGINDPRVTDAGVAHLRGLKNLEELDLSGTQITDAGLKSLAGLTQLQTLDLSNTKVTDAGLVHLKALRLTSLYLGGTNVTLAGLRRIVVQRRTYTFMSVSEDKVSAADVASFKRPYPLLSIGRTRRNDYALNVRLAMKIITTTHLAKRPVDVELSQRWFDNVLAELDPTRTYFTQEDVAKFASQRDHLGELASTNDITLPLEMRDTLLRRKEQVTAWAEEFAAAKHDFTADEEHQLVYEAFAANEDELRDRWRKRVKFELLAAKGDKLDEAQAVKVLQRRYQRIRLKSFDNEELFERYITALAKAYDPHSSYLGERTVVSFNQ